MRPVKSLIRLRGCEGRFSDVAAKLAFLYQISCLLHAVWQRHAQFLEIGVIRLTEA